MYPLRLFTALSITAALMLNLAAAPEDGITTLVAKELAAMNQKREHALAKTRAPFEELTGKYVAALKKVVQSAQGAGNLEKVLMAEREIERAQDGEKEAAPLQDPELDRLCRIYEESLAKMQADALPRLADIERRHADGLRAQITELTQAGMIAEAKKVFQLEQATREAIKTLDAKSLAQRMAKPESPQNPPKGFVLVPAGKFEMGDHLDGDKTAPVHTVHVSAFYMAKHEVTHELWQDVRKWGLKKGYTDLPVGLGKDKDHPVHSIYWYDAVKWCNARSEKDGLQPCYQVDVGSYKTGQRDDVTCDWSANGYRLPTEAEWEKAARGGLVGKRFPWGDAISHKDANFNNKDNEPYQSGTKGLHPKYSRGDKPFTAPVGSFTANGYGIHDMAGNMWEWCWDWHSPSYDASSTNADPRGPSSGSRRVGRSGSWTNTAYGCRTGSRGAALPTNGNFGVGFRPARNAAP